MGLVKSIEQLVCGGGMGAGGSGGFGFSYAGGNGSSSGSAPDIIDGEAEVVETDPEKQIPPSRD